MDRFDEQTFLPSFPRKGVFDAFRNERLRDGAIMWEIKSVTGCLLNITSYTPGGILFPPIVRIALSAASRPAASGSNPCRWVLVLQPVPLTLSFSTMVVMVAVKMVDSSNSSIPMVLFMATFSFNTHTSPPTMMDLEMPFSLKAVSAPRSAFHPRSTMSVSFASMAAGS